jgi:hypothetical protein
VVNDELASGGLDDPPPVGGGVVRLALSEGDSLGHCVGFEGVLKDKEEDGWALVEMLSWRRWAWAGARGTRRMVG